MVKRTIVECDVTQRSRKVMVESKDANTMSVRLPKSWLVNGKTSGRWEWFIATVK